MIMYFYLALKFLIKQCSSAKVDCTQVPTDGYIIIGKSSGQTGVAPFLKNCETSTDLSVTKGKDDIRIWLLTKATKTKEQYQASSNDFVNDNCSVNCEWCLSGSPNACVSCKQYQLVRGLTADQLITSSYYDCSCEQMGYNSQCVCPAGQYECDHSSETNLKSCQGCDYTFETCQSLGKCTDGAKALKCKQGVGRPAQPVNDKCECIDEYEQNPSGGIDCRKKCQAPCLVCVPGNNQQCLSCQSNIMKIDSNQSCVCPQKYYMSSDSLSCIACDFTCGTCSTSSTNCLSCSILSNRIQNSSTCPCKEQYFSIYGQENCVSCQWSCASCYNLDSCTTCSSDKHKTFNYSIDNYCHCETGYAEDINSDECKPCVNTCQTCQGTTDTCSSCVPAQNRQLINSQCVCAERYFSTIDDPICQECSLTCLTCDGGNSDNCLSCLQTSLRILNNKKECQCKQGYGYDDLNSEQCLQCSGICYECDHYQNCIRCPSGINRVLDQSSICICDNGYYEDSNTLACLPCHYSCQTCDDSTPNSCLSCNVDMGRVLDDINKRCDCSPGYYEFYRRCVPCYYTCSACINQFKDGCTQCPISRKLEDETKANSQCLCKSISQIDDGKSLECTDCHYSCSTCYGPDMNNCLTCKDNSSNALTINRDMKFGQCTCPNKWFDDQVNETCLKCHNSCETCFNSDQYSCITCSEIDHRLQLSNSCLCQDGYFENLLTLICEQCDYRCATCQKDKTNCLTCMLGSLRSLVQQTTETQYNTCQCPQTAPNDVEGNPVCQTCHFTCKNCTDKGENQCTICDETANRVIKTDNNGSYCQCILSYYEIQTPECAQCSTYCLGCVDQADKCTQCNPQQFRVLDGNKCVCGSRFGTQQLSYYDNLQDPECVACHYSCYTCNGEQYNQCLTCSDLDFRIKQGNECVCKPKYIDNGEGVCMTCSQSCETCAGQKNLCTSCPPNSLRTLNIQSQSCDCPLGYFDSGLQLCEKCDQSCETCTNFSTYCLSCAIGSNRTLNQFTNQCECLSGYYDSGSGLCSICHFSCLQCSGPASIQCISCPDFISTKRSISSSECVCPDQYFDDSKNQLCQSCSSTCLTCQGNQNSCTQCVLGQNRILEGQECICLSSYYESGSPACSICNNLCQECLTNSTNCTKCDPLLFRTLKQGKCDCNSGYYDDGSLICKQCHYSCQTCINNDQNCTACDNQNFRYLNQNQCICQSGTIDQGIAVCYSCDTRCLTCTNITTQCLTCDATQLRILDGQQCKCQDGYYENNIKQCITCDSNCLTCQLNATTCLSCNQISNKILNSTKCICKDGYYSDSNDCQLCSIKCQTCSTTSTNCTSCKINRILVSNNCNCQDGLYDDGAGGCLQCNYSCLTCSNTATHCLSCVANSQRTLQGQKCACNQGFYDIGGLNCLACDYKCLTCQTSNTSCTSCDSSLKRVQNGTSCDCIAGYFDNGSQLCQQCDGSCVTCIQSASKCTSCDISITFRDDQSQTYNKCPCQRGFYDDGTKNCKKCSYKCINCVGSADNCTFCYINPGYFRNNISPQCNCLDGYFDDGIQIICQNCGPKCLTCQNEAQNCSVCETQSTRLSAPQCDCKPGYFENDQKKCQICSSNCLTCSINSKNCTTCQPDRIQKECLCQDGYYEANQITCQLCSYKCSTCLDHQLNCITCALDRINPPNCICKDHYYDDQVNPECQECDQYCGKCDLNGCINCAANRIQNLRTCICPVDSISYTFTPYCSNCDVAVISGIFSDDLSELIYTFEYDLQFNFPTQVDKQAYCQQLIKEQSLKLIGESPQCRIEEKQLIVSLGSGSSIVIGDILQFNAEILKHTQCQDPLKLIMNQQLLPPAQLLKPQIIVNSPIVPVSPCASIEILIQQQFINGERNLKLNWSSSLSIPAIDVANQLQFQTLTIEQGQVPENSNIEINIAFTNFLGQSDSIKIQFQTLSASVPQFQFKTIKSSFISWAPIKILVYFANTICTNGISKSLNNPVQILFEELVNVRSPQNSNSISFQQSTFNLLESEGLVSAIIPARTLSLNSNYSIISKFQDLQSMQEITAQFNFQIEKSPLMVQIVGGSRIQNYLKSFQIQIQSKDPDLQNEWNQDPDIKLSIECIDLQHSNKACIDQFDKIVPLNRSSNIQYIAARLFKPFTVLLFKVNCSKLNLHESTSAAIILLDAELPTINVSYPEGYKIRDVNINEKLKFQIMIDKNQKLSDFDFSYALVYNYETVYIRNIPNQFAEFAIWEGFQKFSFINQISVRFQAHDIHYLMPQIASVTLTVNMPPVNSIITVLPSLGNALFTQYTIRATNSKDKDSPIQYRYAYYESQKLYKQDVLSGKQENLIILQDFTPVQTLKTQLESGNLTILISISDSLGSTVNFTQQIQSLSFYEQWQLDKENTTNQTSKCKQMIADLSYSTEDIQQLMIASLELIKLLQQNIQQDCVIAINQLLQKNQQQLFQQLLLSSNAIIKSRISNILSKIYQLNLGTASRQLTSQQDSQLCYNTSSNQVQITQLKQILFNQTDSEQIINNISQISTQIQKAIQSNGNLTQDNLITQDIGDDQTTRSLQQNMELRKGYIRILGSLYSKVFQQQMVISGLIDQLMDSFQPNLGLDASGISLQTSGFGLQAYKIGQKKFESFIVVNEYDPENLNLSNFIINRYIQLEKYKNNKYFYTENFKNTFDNGSQLILKKETSRYIYEQSIIPFFESNMLDPQIYVDNNNQVVKMLQLYQGRLGFNMGISVNKCNTNDTLSYDSTKQYQFVCSSFIKEKWVHDSCQTELFTKKNGEINVKCYCDKLYPLSVMIKNTTNTTKSQAPTQKPQIKPEEYINILIADNITIHAIIFISLVIICLTILFKVRKQQISLILIQERLNSKNQEEPIGLTQQPRMSTPLFKLNFKYLHEITRLLYADYIYLSFPSRILLTSININVILTSVHVFNVIIKNYIFAVGITIFVSLIFQLVVKVLEGFLNGPKALKVLGYIISIAINLGVISLNITLNSSEQNYILQILQIIISLIILYGPIELIIQHIKLGLAFTISGQLKLDPFNPVINLIYYFLQDEVVISIVKGAEIY